MKMLVWLGMFIGSTLGSYLPVLWGGSLFSFTSVIVGSVGGILGIWVGYKLAQHIGI
jgi:hypothetical protein